MMESNDIPVEIRNAERTYAAMTLSDKPFMGAGIMTYADAAMHYGTLSIGAPGDGSKHSCHGPDGALLQPAVPGERVVDRYQDRGCSGRVRIHDEPTDGLPVRHQFCAALGRNPGRVYDRFL